MQDIFGSAMKSLESLFLEFNIRRLLFWIFMAVVVVTLFSIVENRTEYTYYLRMEKRAALLERLNNLANDDILDKPELRTIYQKLVYELETHSTEPLTFATILDTWISMFPATSVKFWKFVSGGFWGFLIALAGIVEGRNGGNKDNKTTKWKSTVLGGLLFGFVTGGIGLVLPTIYAPTVNFIGWPTIQLVMILFFSKVSARKT